MPDQQQTRYPRLAQDHPEASLGEDTIANAQKLRHDVKDVLNSVQLVSIELMQTSTSGRAPGIDLQREWSATLARSVDRIRTLVDVVKALPREEPHQRSG